VGSTTPDSPSRLPQLGPWVLLDPVARGGMAEVWRAHHALDDVPGAVKVLLPHRLDRDHHRRQFEQEGVVLASLHHPGVVAVHDRGEVDEAAASASRGRIVAGAPYLALDWLPHGSLWPYRGRLSWAALRPLLTGLLDALGHTHARGWVHRDLKPSNVLVSRSRRPVLADFGLANRCGQPLLMRAGTPSYMAPEQFRDQWRDIGPWTDLYGLGCLVWTLVTGEAPYPREGWHAVRDAHLHEALPRLGPHDGPGELEGWLRELLVKDPAKRLQTAADAAYALAELWAGEPTTESSIPTLDPIEGPVEPTHTEQQAVEFEPDPRLPEMEIEVGRHERPPPAVVDPGPAAIDVEPPLRGTGRGLLPHRRGPLRGRDRERRALWRALLAAHEVPLARVAVVTGPPGVGRSRLVRDVAHRAHELGMAWVLGENRATTAASSLSDLLRAHLGLDVDDPPDDLRLAEVARRNGTEDPRDQAALAELVRGGRPEARHLAALGRHLATLGARRPVMIVVDEPEGTPPGDRSGLVALVDWLLSSRHTAPTPVFVVWVARARSELDSAESGPPAASPGDGPAHRRWLGRPGVDRVGVGPLPNRMIRAIVRSWMALDETDVLRIARQAAGHVGVARRLVFDFLHRGVVGPVPVEPGVSALLDDLDEGDGVALELAATMGQVVPVGMWRRQAAEVGAVRDDAWLARMAGRGVLERLVRRGADRPEEFRFRTPALRQGLLDRSRERGRLKAMYQLTVAGHLADPPRGRWTWGDQLAHAGLDELAIPAWLAAAEALSDRGDPAGASVLAERAAQRAERVSPSDGPRIAEARARYALQRGRLQGIGPIPGAAWDPTVAVAFLRGAEPLPPRTDTPDGDHWRGRALLRIGDLDGAVETLTRHRDRPEAVVGLSLAWAARIERWRGDEEAARAWLEAIGTRDRGAPVRWARELVEVEGLRARGRLGAAIDRLTALVGQLSESGGVDPVRAQLELAVLLALAGHYVEADPLVRGASIEAVRREDRSHRHFGHAASALVARGLLDDARLEVELESLAVAERADPEVYATITLLAERLGPDRAALLQPVLAGWRAGPGLPITALRWWDPPLGSP